MTGIVLVPENCIMHAAFFRRASEHERGSRGVVA